MWDQLHHIDTYPGPGDLPQAGVLVPLYEDGNGDIRVVLTKRPDTMPTHAGHISFPGGRPHPGDGGPVGTAIREAQEEVGIDPDQVTVLGFLEPIDTVEYKLMVVPVVARISTPLNLVRSEREVARIYQPRLADLADPDQWAYVPWQSWKAWYFNLEGDTLWGATAHMVRLLLDLD
ncbi:MAG: CoA pyrophosphatase [Acidimicrobiia bacterium]